MANINNYLQEHGSVLSQEIKRRITPSSPWLMLPKQKFWPEEMSHTLRSVVWERTYPDTINDWSDIATPDGNGNPCLPNVDLLEFNQTVRTTTLQAKAIESPEFCVDDLRVKWKRKEQMGLVVKQLEELTRNYWIDRNRDQYVAACNTKVVLEPNLTSTDESAGDAFPLVEPTSRLTNEACDHFWMYLEREGAASKALTKNNGQAIYGLICSAETSRYLTKTDGAVREDFRNSTRRDELLRGMGYNQTYNGFFHMIDSLPRRFDFVTGAWVRRDPWVKVGNKWEQNPLYINAAYEDTIIWVEDVYTKFVPKSIPSVGNASFTAQNYVGDFRWLNIKHRTDNPDGKLGFYRGVLTAGYQKMHTEFGITIRHKRCPIDLNFTDC